MQRLLTFLIFWCFLSAPVFLHAQKLNVFIDCQTNCDFTYIRQEVDWINYMQDRYTADVYILATDQRTGSGGRNVQFITQGNGKYASLTDTILYDVSPDDMDATIREKFVSNLKKSLLPYLAISPMADKISYTIDDQALEDDEGDEIDDPWNYWVFNVGANGNYNGEASFSNYSVTGRFSASRVTEENKLFLFTRYNYESSVFTLSDGEKIDNIIKSYSNWMRYVLSINDHWSAGITAQQGSSTFGNTDIEGSFKPAIEYNVFPYSEAATKRLSFFYSIGPEYKNYTELTIFDKLSETVMRHGLRVEFDQVQKWGEVEIDLGANQYLHSPDLFSVFINPELDWSITTGLQISVGGFLEWVGDRINIAKSDLSDEEILLQIKQLDTDYSFFSYVSINFRFGSKYNNFVNPRF